MFLHIFFHPLHPSVGDIEFPMMALLLSSRFPLKLQFLMLALSWYNQKASMLSDDNQDSSSFLKMALKLSSRTP